ncbi:hypothetical protein ACH4F6_07030 [Streptomyces sp. NPDC017936]|uniref:hypothetical protein n=1 Tax=Streptomyces sp. NPDC017936 TaxID=3365016 RepID=UPI0037BBD758
MSSLKATLCAGAALAATAIGPTAIGPTAYAADGGSASGDVSSGPGEVSVNPSSPSPGTEVSLRVRGCAGKTATAVSTAFVSEARLVAANGALVGETRVRSSLTLGSYGVTVTCADYRVSSRFKVAMAPVKPSSHASAPALAHASPVAPVRAGGGGTAPLASAGEARVDSPGTAHAVTGLVLAGVAAVVVVLRTVRRSGGTG